MFLKTVYDVKLTTFFAHLTHKTIKQILEKNKSAKG